MKPPVPVHTQQCIHTLQRRSLLQHSQRHASSQAAHAMVHRDTQYRYYCNLLHDSKSTEWMSTATPVVEIAAAAAKGDHGCRLCIPVRLWKQLHSLWKP